jgi:hypothetical protein
MAEDAGLARSITERGVAAGGASAGCGRAANGRMRDAASAAGAPPREKGLTVPKAYPTFSVPPTHQKGFMGRSCGCRPTRINRSVKYRCIRELGCGDIG